MSEPISLPLEWQCGPLSEEQREQFLAAFAQREQATLAMMRIAASALDNARASEEDFVGDELALLLNVHPLTGRAFAIDASLSCAFPELLTEMEAGHLSERHVKAAVEALHAHIALHDDRLTVLARVLERCRERVAAGKDWPRPGELGRMIQKAALLLDLQGAQKRREKVRTDRGVDATALPDGAALLSIYGPAEEVLEMIQSIEAEAATLVRRPGETRTRTQCAYDLTRERLTGQTSTASGPVRSEAQVIIPFSTATGGDLELAELPGYGPILPSTARELLAQATHLRRVCVDADTGEVIAVDDAVAVDGDLDEALQAMATDPVVVRDLSSKAYRPPPRLKKLVQIRDRTCTFPGCPQPAERCDLDHRQAYPDGPTCDCNLHCLCRHHHRAKQHYFTVIREADGTTVWITKDGHEYRRPPPTW